MTAALLDRPLEVLTLGLQGELFAIEATLVREILDPVPVTEVPGARRFAAGVINVRGKVVPLADLRLRFGMPAVAATVDTRIVVVEVMLEGDPVVVGLLADKVFEVTQIAPAAATDTPRIGMRWPAEFVRFIGKRGDDFIIVPDLPRILT
jgi:purine-binding chemotaxis protein CheW